MSTDKAGEDCNGAASGTDMFVDIAPDASAWDDSALIRAYNRAAQTHRAAAGSSASGRTETAPGNSTGNADATDATDAKEEDMLQADKEGTSSDAVPRAADTVTRSPAPVRVRTIEQLPSAAFRAAAASAAPERVCTPPPRKRARRVLIDPVARSQPRSEERLRLGNVRNDTNTRSRSAGDIAPPPPPPPLLELDGDLQALLRSWYEAGYHAGLYVGRRAAR